MRVVVTGANGQLGQDVVLRLKAEGHTPICTDIDTLDITEKSQVVSFFTTKRPDAVIHCAAYTAVDKAESEKDICEKINVLGTENVAYAAELCSAKMIYISTDYVYGGFGTSPLQETQEPAPLNVYGQTKLQGEIAAKQNCSRLFIVRTSWVFGLHGGNFVKTMLRLSETHDTLTVVSDQVGSPTFAEDLAVVLCGLLQTEQYGTYNVTNEGFCSWNTFAKAIFEEAAKAITVLPTTTEAYGAPALRPLNSRLSKEKLYSMGFSSLPTWQDALHRFMTAFLSTED